MKILYIFASVNRILTLKILEKGYNYVGQKITHRYKETNLVYRDDEPYNIQTHLSQFTAAKLIDIG